jgi:hypothetical protein
MTNNRTVKPLVFLLMIGLVFLFAGCFEISEELWFNDDGSARLRYDFGAAQVLLDRAGPGRSSGLFGGFSGRFRGHADVTKFLAQEYKEPGFHHWRFDIEVSDYRLLADILNALMSEEVALAGDSAGAPDAEIGRGASGGVDFLQSFERYTRRSSPADSATGVRNDTSLIRRRFLEKALFSEAFGERFITVKVHAGEFLSANGTIDTLKGTAEWKIRLVDSLAHPPGRDIVRAEIRLGKRTNWLFILELAASILLIAGLLLNRLRKRDSP